MGWGVLLGYWFIWVYVYMGVIWMILQLVDFPLLFYYLLFWLVPKGIISQTFHSIFAQIEPNHTTKLIYPIIRLRINRWIFIRAYSCPWSTSRIRSYSIWAYSPAIGYRSMSFIFSIWIIIMSKLIILWSGVCMIILFYAIWKYVRIWRWVFGWVLFIRQLVGFL